MRWCSQIRLLFVLIGAVAMASAQTGPPDYPYLLRIEHATFQTHACALLQNDGTFHLEIERGDRTKVFEGSASPGDLLAIRNSINSAALANLSQGQIEEPLIAAHRDTLRLHIHRSDHWQGLVFESTDSQDPFRQWLRPLAQWIDGLRKFSQRELSEDAGKNNCLPAKTIALSKRGLQPGEVPVRKTQPAPLISHAANAPSVTRQSASALLYLRTFAIKSAGANQTCALIAGDGAYRFEERTQKNGSRQVATEVLAGQIAPEELKQLRQLLDEPSLAKIGHREPPGSKPLMVIGDLTEIEITRGDLVQSIVLSSGFNRRQVGFFYAGDADPGTVRPLLKFLTEHVQSRKSQRLPPTFRNDCQSP